MKKSGFTLAEVLITLGIVGVVAALALPSLIADTTKQQIGPKLAKAVSSFEQANEALLSENGVDYLTDVYSDAKVYVEALGNYMKCSRDGATLTAKDGVSYTINSDLSTSTSESYKPHNNYVKSTVTVDLNGPSSPNVSSEDIFKFGLYNDGTLRPVGGDIVWNADGAGKANTKWNSSGKCEADTEPGTPDYCAGHIFANNFKVLYK